MASRTRRRSSGDLERTAGRAHECGGSPPLSYVERPRGSKPAAYSDSRSLGRARHGREAGVEGVDAVHEQVKVLGHRPDDVERVVDLGARQRRDALAHLEEHVLVPELLVGVGVRDERVDHLVRVRVVLPHRGVEVVDRARVLGVAGVLRHLQELVAGVVAERVLGRRLHRKLTSARVLGSGWDAQHGIVREEAAEPLPVDVAVVVLLDEVPGEVRHHLGRRVGGGDRHVLVGALDVVVLLESEARAPARATPCRSRPSPRTGGRRSAAASGSRTCDGARRTARPSSSRRSSSLKASTPVCPSCCDSDWTRSRRARRSARRCSRRRSCRRGTGSILPNSCAAAPSSVTSSPIYSMASLSPVVLRRPWPCASGPGASALVGLRCCLAVSPAPG